MKIIKFLNIAMLLALAVIVYSCKDKEDINNSTPQDETKVKLWLTDPSQNIKFAEQTNLSLTTPTNGLELITVNENQVYQTMDGFGFSLTGGSAYHIFNMNPEDRKKLLTELFDTEGTNIGTSYLRVSIGASDLDAKVFSYNDLPSGQTDTAMQYFSLAEDQKFLIPVLKEILAINPDIKILGSPWSAPLWMKTNRGSVGGSLRPEYFKAYAKYFVKYIQGMKTEGITIDAITIQNEPLHDGNNPSMYMSAADQTLFIKNALGPAFRDANITTKIIIYDHNADRIDYPLSILNDPDAKQYVDGSAFHLYGGTINALTTVHNSHPDKNLYFTEQWVGAGSDFGETVKNHIKDLTIGGSRNWCKTILEWNLAADQNQDPHTPGGCTACLGAVTIENGFVTRNPAYYIVAHASKFVRPGSKRIESNTFAQLPNVAYLTPSGKIVVVVVNTSGAKKYFNMQVKGKVILASLNANGVGTYIWD